MTTTTLVKTAGTVLLTAQTVQSNAVVVGTAVDVSAKLGAQVFVNAGRVPGSLASGNAPVFQIQGLADTGSEWAPIYTWTTANHIYAPTAQTLNSNAAAGAVSVQLSAALGSNLSNPMLIYNSANPALSEFNQAQVTSTATALNNSLTGAQTAGVAIGVSHAEQWSFPIDVTALTRVRLVVNNIWNAVAQPYLVSAKINTTDNATTA